MGNRASKKSKKDKKEEAVEEKPEQVSCGRKKMCGILTDSGMYPYIVYETNLLLLLLVM